MLGHAACADLFGAGSRAEIPVIGRLAAADGSMLDISGRIDRLAVSASQVVVADFKTDRLPPQSLAALAPAYLDQLALYGAVLARIFPGRTVAARLVYTSGPLIFELPPADLQAALARLTGA